VGNFDYAMDEALDIAMNYLSRTDQVVNFRLVQTVAAKAIIAAWQSGARRLSAVLRNLPRKFHLFIRVSCSSALVPFEQRNNVLRHPQHCIRSHSLVSFFHKIPSNSHHDLIGQSTWRPVETAGVSLGRRR
jgi:hypothetical protein